ISQDGPIETAIHATQYGIYEYFTISQGPELISRWIRNAISWTATNVIKRRTPIQDRQLLIGLHPEILKINERAKIFAVENKPLLVSGEAGTGKQHLAYGIHRLALPRFQNFIRYDCHLLQQISKYDGLPVPRLIDIGIQGLRKKAVKGVLFLRHLEQLNRDQQEDILERSSGSSIKLIASYQEP